MYKFDKEDAFRFARERGIRARVVGNELRFTKCPYCQSTKDKDTFAISLETGQFECKRAKCGIRGNMIVLSRDFDFSLGKEVDAYYKTVDYSRKQYRQFVQKHIETKETAIEYMDSRDIFPEIVRKYEITMSDKQKYVMVFPFRDENGELLPDEVRLTSFGKLLRATSLDELPQLWNVLKGDMSIVGPRPERKEHVVKYSETLPEFDFRLKVRGGLTGYAQIYGKYNTSAYDKLRLDMLYIENYSILMDIRLILMTLRIMLQKESTEGFEKVEENERLLQETLDKLDKEREENNG